MTAIGAKTRRVAATRWTSCSARNLDLGPSRERSACCDEAEAALPTLQPGRRIRGTPMTGPRQPVFRARPDQRAMQSSGARRRLRRAEIIERPIEECANAFAYGVIERSLFESAPRGGPVRQDDHERARGHLRLGRRLLSWTFARATTSRAVRGDLAGRRVRHRRRDHRRGIRQHGRTIRAIRFKDPNGVTDYFTPEGDSVRKAFLRAPVDFTRISSNFNPNRRIRS